MDKYINATHLIQTLEDTKPLIDSSPVSSFQKTVCKMTLDGAIQYMQKEMAADGEFCQVVHAHWIEHLEDFGEIFFVECSACHSSKNVDESRFCPDCGAIMDGKVDEVEF